MLVISDFLLYLTESLMSGQATLYGMILILICLRLRLFHKINHNALHLLKQHVCHCDQFLCTTAIQEF